MYRQIRYAVWLGLGATLLILPGCRHKYDNPITKDTQQPDKVLFDTSIDDIEHGRFERARLTLQTMMNTYDTSEYLAKAKLAVADSWKREGGAHGMAQAEAEYKDFILFYPNMEEAAEAQYKICDMQYQQMDKADRDTVHAKMADAECKQVLQQYPNSKFATDAANKDREIQEVLAEAEMVPGLFYHKKGGNGYPASANRLTNMVNQYPLYSRADEALWVAADDYLQMGDKFENQQADAYSRIVRDYPLSEYADEAKANLKAMGRAVPDADPVAEARMKFELANRPKRTLLGKAVEPFLGRPYTGNAAKSGNPQMESFKPTIPLDVPEKALGGAGVNTVTIAGTQPGADIIDKAPDARAAGTDTAAGAANATPAAGDKPAADKPADANAGTPAAGAPGTEKTAVTPAANTAAVKGKKLKAPKPPEPPKKKARPADNNKPDKKSNKKKSTAPATNTNMNSTTPAQPPAKTNGGQ